MPASAFDGELERVDGRHEGTGSDTKNTNRHIRPVVDAVNLFDSELVHQARLEHRRGSLDGLFGGLEDQNDLAHEIARLRKMPRGAKQHCGVAVVPAGMDDALFLEA